MEFTTINCYVLVKKKTQTNNWERIAISIKLIGIISVFRRRSVTKSNLLYMLGVQENEIFFGIVTQKSFLECPHLSF